MHETGCSGTAASAPRAPSWTTRATASLPRPVPATWAARWWLPGRSFTTTAWCGEGPLSAATLPHLLHTETQGLPVERPSPCPPLSPCDRDHPSGPGRCPAGLEPAEGRPGCTTAPASPLPCCTPPLPSPSPGALLAPPLTHPVPSGGGWGPHRSPAEGACPWLTTRPGSRRGSGWGQWGSGPDCPHPRLS